MYYQKTNKYDKGYYILLGVFFLIKAINHSKNRHAWPPVYIISKSSADYIAITNVLSKFDSDWKDKKGGKSETNNMIN